jgi:hypothetical protein
VIQKIIIKEAREWLKDEHHSILEVDVTFLRGANWVEDLYNAGAVKVEAVIDASVEQDPGWERTDTLLVTIPPDPSKLRKLIITVSMLKPDCVWEEGFSQDGYHQLKLWWY